ncbi:MAG: T9SS type A sorting domain-containing protein, partial [Bacteroidetes bacterium]|nr:T9SS type A sorting domain-containing protein [Bacteroidota bacterium]
FKFTATDNRGLVSTSAVYKIPVQISALPIILSSFSAVLDNNIVKLSWTTEQESNSDKFIIEKSVDGNNWQILATAKAAGNSFTVLNYSTTDGQPASMNYYRLKMVDLDGSFIYSKVLRVSKKEMTVGAIKVFPNPVTNSAAVSITTSANETVSVKVFSTNGMLVKEVKSQVSTGVTNIDIPGVSQLAKGIYTVVLNDETGNRKGAVQFVKQ